MNEWSLLYLEPVEEHPGYYTGQFYGEGTPGLVADLTMYKEPGMPARITACKVTTAISDQAKNGITPGQLRAIPYGQLTAMSEYAIVDMLNGDPRAFAPTEPEVLLETYDFDELKKQWPKGDLVKVSTAVADVYISAIGFGKPPKPAVAEAFNTSTATAGRMIAKARELGILNVSSVGGRPKAKGTDNGEESTKRR